LCGGNKRIKIEEKALHRNWKKKYNIKAWGINQI
jgi:hypothetical protein